MKISLYTAVLALIAPASLASVIGEPTCNVIAAVINVTYAPKESTLARTRLTVKVETTIETGALGGCGLVDGGDVFETTFGPDLHRFAVGDRLAAGIQRSSTRGLGSTISFLHWQPVSCLNRDLILPSSFSFSTPLEPVTAPHLNRCKHRVPAIQRFRYALFFHSPLGHHFR